VYTEKYPDVFPLERYCLQCLEKGTEVYVRLLYTMIPDMDELRKKQAVDDAMLRPFCQYVALVMQRSEIQHPRLLNASATNIRKRQRDNSYGILEARYQLAKACGYRLPI